MLVPVLLRGIDEGKCRTSQFKTVDQQLALGIVQTQPQRLIGTDPLDQSAAATDGGFGEAIGGDLGLGPGQLEPLGQQLFSIAVEVEQAARH